MASFVPKYAPQANSFNEMLTTCNNSLIDSSQDVDNLSGKIKLDANVEDSLALNTIIMTKKISEEIESKIENNISLGSNISSAAKKFDDEDYEAFLAEERRRLALEKARQEAESEGENN